MDAVKASAKNTAPFLAGGGDLALGTVEYVTIEVLTDLALRYILKAPRRSVTDLAIIHALTIPILGGVSAVFSNTGPVDYETGTLLDQVKDGAKGIPAVFIAQAIYGARSGIRIPRGFNLKDLLVTALAKTITKPMTSFIYPYLPEKGFKSSLREVNRLFRAEIGNSNLARAS